MIFTMAPFTVFFVPVRMVMSSTHLDWHIDMLCRVSHGFVISVGRGMLDRLVVDMGLGMSNWF